MIRSGVYKNNATAYARLVMRRWVGRWWGIFAIPVIILLIAALWQIEFVVVALALLLLIYPFALMIVYYNYALSPKAIESLSPHRVIYRDDDTIHVISEPDENYHIKYDDRFIDCKKLNDVSLSGDNMILIYSKSPDGFEIIPKSVFDNIEANWISNRLLSIIHSNCVNLQNEI